MEKLHIKGSKFAPTIDFDPNTGELSISGQSYHENTDEFYKPVLAWLEDYLLNEGLTVKVTMKMEYFNTATAKIFHDMFEKLDKYNDEKGEVSIDWYYQKNDIDMQEHGEEYDDDLYLNIKMHPVDDLFKS